MKYLFEYAKFRELLNKDNFDDINKNFKNIDFEFKDDENLIKVIHIPKYNKDIFLKWYTVNHSMIERIEKRTNFVSVSEFNDFIKKGVIDLFENHFNEIDSTARYALTFKENKFSLLIDINYDDLFKKYTLFFIPSIVSRVHDVYKEIIINDEYF